MKMRLTWIVVAVISLIACSSAENKPERRASMSRRERDSVLSQSGLPGAHVVGRAITASDAEARHTATLDSASQ